LAIINHDDVWESDFLELLLDALASAPRAVVAFADHSVIGPNGLVDEAATEAMSARWGRSQLEPGYHPVLAELAIVRQTLPVAVSALFRGSALTEPI
jgi:GT2 family glycosyltransferase